MAQEAAVPSGFWARVQKMIDDSIARYARSGPLRNAMITEGGLSIKGGALKVLFPDSKGGGVGVYFGDQVITGTNTYVGTGLLVQDENGRDIATFRTDTSGFPIAILRDGQQNAVLFTDTGTGQGFGQPWFTGPFYLTRNSDWPTVTSTAFETVYRAKVPKLNPKLEVRTWGVNNIAGATGEIRILVNDVQLGATFATSSNAVAEGLFYGNVAGAFGTELVVQIQARLASGTGGVQVGASKCLGRN